MPKIKTVELPVTVVRWLTSLAEDGLYAPLSKEGSNMTSEERNKREVLIDTVCDLTLNGKPTSYHIAARDMAAWQESRSGLTWAQLCGITRTLAVCRESPGLCPGGLLDLDTLEALAQRAAGEES
tara:strand:- start:174 stop:548 length:375 start_codon:yes stop_codon:yes gene_type:complete